MRLVPMTAEQKKLALVERYGGLKEKQLDKVMERKRKKKASKERKNMPWERRGVAAAAAAGTEMGGGE